MARYNVKFLNPQTGKYEDAGVAGLGNLEDLRTSVKTDLVSAINSIYIDGVPNNGTPPNVSLEYTDIQNQIAAINEKLKTIREREVRPIEWDGVNEKIEKMFGEVLKEIKDTNAELILELKPDIDLEKNEAFLAFKERLNEQQRQADSLRQEMEAGQADLSKRAMELEKAQLGFQSVKQEVDEINGVLSDTVRTIDMDLFNAMTNDYKSLTKLTKEGFGVEASKDSLSHLSGRITKHDAQLKATNHAISGKVGVTDWQYLPIEPSDTPSPNKLMNSRDFKEWDISNGNAIVSDEQFRHGKVMEITGTNGYLTTTVEGLNIGDSYTATVYANIQPDNLQSINEFQPVSESELYNVTFHHNEQSEPMTEIVEDISGLNGWRRLKVNFIATAQSETVSFRFSSPIPSGSKGYLSAPQIEVGLKATPFRPSDNDKVVTLSNQLARINVNSQGITQLVESKRQTEGKLESLTSSITQLDKGTTIQAERLREVDNKVTSNGASIKLLNDSITNKVWEEDFDKLKSDIMIDNRNRILNSDFSRLGDEAEGRPSIENWFELDELFRIEKIGKYHWLAINRSGLEAVNIAAAYSQKFLYRPGERLMFGVDIIIGKTPPLDNEKLIAFELFDESDVRVSLIQFSLSDLKTKKNSDGSTRYYGYLEDKRADVSKARLKLQLPKNGNVKFTKAIVQQGTIGFTDWSRAPEDYEYIQAELMTEINQNARKVEILASDKRIEALTGLLVEREGRFEVSGENIIQRVTSKELGENALVKGTELKLSEDNIKASVVGKDEVIQTINASREGLLIDFEKVAVTGELLANKLSTASLDISEGFQLVNNGIPIIRAEAGTGEVVMQVSRFQVSGVPVATRDDIENISLTPGASAYLHIAYADFSNGDGFSLTDSSKPYMGVYSSHDDTQSNQPRDYIWSRIRGRDGIDGAQGPRGEKGIPGERGIDGSSSYTHIAYADDGNGGGFSQSDSSKDYIGILINNSQTSPNTPREYVWSKWRGEDGAQGIPGKNGKDGKTSYTHFAYATSSDGSQGFSTTNSTNKTYIGVYSDFTAQDSTSYSVYSWSKIKGEDGAPGADGIGEKVFIAYANSSDGTKDFSLSPDGHTYLGSYAGTGSQSRQPNSYNWTKILFRQLPSRNLLIDSNKRTSLKTSGKVGEYRVSERPSTNETMTLTLKASIPNGKYLNIKNGDNTQLGRTETSTTTGNDIYTTTFPWKDTQSDDVNLTLHLNGYDSNGASIEWAVLNRGESGFNDWTPSDVELASMEFASSINNKVDSHVDILDNHGDEIRIIKSSEFIEKEQGYKDKIEDHTIKIHDFNIAIGPIKTTTEKINQSFEFGNSLTIGNKHSSHKLKLSHDKIEFVTDGVVGTFLNGTRLNTKNLLVGTSIQLENHIISSVNNKTVFRYIGD